MHEIVQLGFGFGYYSDMSWMALYGVEGEESLWFGMGKKFEFNLNIWLHTCVTFDLENGSVQMFENGIKRGEDKNEKMVTIKNSVSDRGFESVYIGCHVGTDRGDTHAGIVTDFHLFSRVLSEKELVSWTSCEERLEGDVLNWETESWILNKNGDGSEIEYLDFERNICDMKERSYNFIPVKIPNFEEGVYMCERVSGKLNM